MPGGTWKSGLVAHQRLGLDHAAILAMQVQVHVLLRVGQVDASLVIAQLDLFQQGDLGAELVGRLHVAADAQLDGVVAQLVHHHVRLGRRQHAAVGLHQRDGGFTRQLDVVLVTDADHQFDAARRLGGEVDDRRGGDQRVGNGGVLVVGAGDDGLEDAHFAHGAGLPGHGHHIAHAERAQGHQHHPGGDVGQRILQCQADGQAGSTEHGQQRGNRHAQRIDGQHDHDDQRGRIHHVAHEIAEHRVHAHPCRCTRQSVGHPSCQPHADQQHHDGGKQRHAVGFEQAFPIQRMEPGRGGGGDSNHAGSFAAVVMAYADARNRHAPQRRGVHAAAVWADANESDVSALFLPATGISSIHPPQRGENSKITELGGGMSFSKNLSQWLERDLSGRRLAALSSAKLCIASDVGLVRNENQDRAAAMWMSCPAHGEVLVSVVSDGMGGMRDGGRCATIAVTSFLYYFAHFSSDNLLRDVADSIQYSNSEVNRIYGGRGGATLSVLALTAAGAKVVANVGDSRVYSFGSPGGVKRWTVDDSLAEVIGGGGRELVQFVGMGVGIRPAIVEVVGDYFCFAITSDGVHSLEEATLFEVMRNSSSVAQLTERLLALSRWCGGRDNSSCIVLDAAGIDVGSLGFDSAFVRIWDSSGDFSCSLDSVSPGDLRSSVMGGVKRSSMVDMSSGGTEKSEGSSAVDDSKGASTVAVKPNKKPRKSARKSAQKGKSADSGEIQLSIEIGSQKNSGG